MKEVRRGQVRQVKVATEVGETLARMGRLTRVPRDAQFWQLTVGEKLEKLASRKDELLMISAKTGKSTARVRVGQFTQENEEAKVEVEE